jgi:superfamily II DNA/RNA helicase
MDIADRQAHIQPVHDKLAQWGFDDDLKLRQFSTVLDPILERESKAVVFLEQHATVAYLEEAIMTPRPNWRYSSTITATPDGKYRMKPQREVARLIERFAPVANRSASSDDPIDTFLSTDAHGIGVNLQDAEVVINYDLAWTPTEPAQRAGRVLRLWREPRTIQLYAFVPSVGAETRAALR